MLILLCRSSEHGRNDAFYHRRIVTWAEATCTKHEDLRDVHVVPRS
jgi:hypothetical protein